MLRVHAPAVTSEDTRHRHRKGDNIMKKDTYELPSRYWEPQPEGPTEEEINEAQEWLEQNGIPYDPDLPFN